MFIVVDFAGTRGAHDRHKLAFTNRQRNATQRVNFNVAHRVGLVDVIQLDHRARFRHAALQNDLWLAVARLQTLLTSSSLNLAWPTLFPVLAHTDSVPTAAPPTPPPPPPVRGALPNPGGRDCVFALTRSRQNLSGPVMTISPSFRSPSTTSVAAPSLRPTVIRRRSGLPSWPITQTTRI